MVAVSGNRFWAAQVFPWPWTPPGGLREYRHPLLGSCGTQSFDVFLSSADKNMIESGPDDSIDVWSRRFRQDVTTILESLSDPEAELECSGPNGTQPVPPLLRTIAGKLLPWQDPLSLADLQRHDTGLVLQEYLRTYECALEERRFFLFPAALHELVVQLSTQGLLDVGDLISISSITLDKGPEQDQKIEREFKHVRPMINRATALALGMDRFGGLEAEITCLQRASLDLRNGAALAAQAAAQLNRILDAKDPLRDYDAFEP